MANRTNPSFVHLNFIIQLLIPLSSSLFSPQDNYLISCGSISPVILHDKRIFFPDFTFLNSNHPQISLSNDSNTPLYRSARVFTSPSSYEFKIRKKGTHIIRLHFYPFYNRNHNLSSAHFHVLVPGVVLLNNFTASADSPVKEFVLRLDLEKILIFFVPVDSSSIAFVNAIEIISAPEELFEDKLGFVQTDKVSSFDGFSWQAMETMFRINVGGPKVTPFNDSLWRTWVNDNEFFYSDSGFKIVTFGGRIMYRRYGASREIAPESVYNTARIIDVVNSSDASSRLTWKFSVDVGYKYLIRMHFCDIASLALNELYFNVYINGYIVYENFDISSATGQVLASPYYLDFVSDVEDSGLLFLSIGNSRFVPHSRVDGLLNGLEIFKLNNTVGSLNGKLPFALVLNGSRGGFSWFGFMILSVVGFMLIWRWRTDSKRHISWYPLSLDASEGEIVKGGQFL